MTRLRKATACALLGGVGLMNIADGQTWRQIAFGALVIAGAIALGRRSAAAQVFARGAAWASMFPSAIASILIVSHLRDWPNLFMVTSIAAASLALMLGRPMLDGAEAQETFAPIAFRSWLLAAAVSAMGVGIATTRYGAVLIGIHFARFGAPLLGLGLALILSAIGIVRMRAWGMLLGIATVPFALVSALAVRATSFNWPLLGTLVPGVMIAGILVSARLRNRPTRVAHRPARIRVSSEPTEPTSELETAAEPASLRPAYEIRS
jgi:hypothetical protein